jgi:hypothetical protein
MSEEKGKWGAPKGARRAEKHGGEGAVKALQRGEPFGGLAAQEEQRVAADLEDQGRAAMVQEQATRLHTASRLYWQAVQKAADDGDLEKLDSYVARFGWLAGASLRAWEQVRKEDAARPKALDYDQLVKELKQNAES